MSPGTHKCAVDDLPVAVDVIYMQTTLPVKKRSLSLPRLRGEYYCCIAAARVILTVTKNGFASRINHSTANKHARNAAQKLKQTERGATFFKVATIVHKYNV